MNIHPKTSGAAIGVALGVVIDAVLRSIHGVHLDGTVYGAITGFLGILSAYLAPAGSSSVTPVTGNKNFLQEPPVE